MSSCSIRVSTGARFPSDISDRSGFRVLLYNTGARSLICHEAIKSTTFICTRSQLRSLLSISMSSRARSRRFSADFRPDAACFNMLGFQRSLLAYGAALVQSRAKRKNGG